VTRSAAGEITDRVLGGFADYRRRFRVLTRRAPERFAARQWRAGQQDARERLTLYQERLEATLRDVADARADARDPSAWARAKEAFAGAVDARPDAELGRTFFNSVSRRALGTVGTCPEAEFLGDELGPRPGGEPLLSFRRYPVEGSLEDALERLLRECPVDAPFRRPEEDAGLAADAVREQLGERRAPDPERLEAFEMPGRVFYRNKGAYLVGRMRWPAGTVPFLAALVHRREGVEVDAVLTSADEISVVFGFSRSYFHVDLAEPSRTVAFLGNLLHLKRVDEIYTSLGYNRHGKTEFYRTLRDHLERPRGVFREAEGQPGMVMKVFTLPSMNVVFKVIRDRFPAPKQTTREQVKRKYRLVFMRDRVGRLADAQEFEHVELREDRFPEPLLEELLEDASRTVHLEGDRVVVEHLYTERRMTPLDLYLERAPASEARKALLDYGRAIKDLAAANVFPGDLLLKNFGVSRHGRVVFYDYDELALLEDCRFRELPEPRTPQEAMADEPWYHVAPDDVFPEEFPRFLSLPEEHRDAFMERHADLFEPAFWRGMQERQAAGEVVDFYPYRPSRRLRRDGR
jgi:isocitrate dehydrogenase kinase/phosphatase